MKKRAALLAVVVGVAVLVAVAHASGAHKCTGENCASAQVVTGANIYEFLNGSCQTVGGDFSVSIAGEGVYLHLIWTPKDHGNYRSVVWHYSKREEGDLIPATIKLAHGRTSGTFSGVSTRGVRTTGSFSCG
jgi:hypothetical protein